VLLEDLDFDAEMETGPGILVRTLASLLCQVEDLQRWH